MRNKWKTKKVVPSRAISSPNDILQRARELGGKKVKAYELNGK